MSWTRLSDEWTERRIFEDLPYDARWHYLCMIQTCSRKQLWDGRLRRTDALRCSDVPEPADVLEMLIAVEIVKPDGAHVIVSAIDEHVPPPSVRLESERAKVRMRRMRKHKAGDHSECLPGHCEHVPSDVTDDVTRNTRTGQDGTGQALRSEDEASERYDVTEPPLTPSQESSSSPATDLGEPEHQPSPLRPGYVACPECQTPLDDNGHCGWCNIDFPHLAIA